MYEVIVKFSKKGKSRYLSHLDLLRLFQRSIRRAEMPVKISQGFTPRMKLSIIPAIKLGMESEGLEAKFVLTEKINEEEVKERLQKQLCMDLTIQEVKVKNV